MATSSWSCPRAPSAASTRRSWSACARPPERYHAPVRLATLLFAFLTLSASGDFFIGDTGVAPERPRLPSGRTIVAGDGERFYVIAANGMNRVDRNGAI